MEDPPPAVRAGARGRRGGAGGVLTRAVRPRPEARPEPDRSRPEARREPDRPRPEARREPASGEEDRVLLEEDGVLLPATRPADRRVGPPHRCVRRTHATVWHPHLSSETSCARMPP